MRGDNKGPLFCEEIGEPGAGASTVRLAPLERASSLTTSALSSFHVACQLKHFGVESKREKKPFDSFVALFCCPQKADCALFTFSLIGRLNTYGPSFVCTYLEGTTEEENGLIYINLEYGSRL